MPPPAAGRVGELYFIAGGTGPGVWVAAPVGGREAVAAHLAPAGPAAAGSSRKLRGPAGSHLEMLRRQCGPR